VIAWRNSLISVRQSSSVRSRGHSAESGSQQVIGSIPSSFPLCGGLTRKHNTVATYSLPGVRQNRRRSLCRSPLPRLSPGSSPTSSGMIVTRFRSASAPRGRCFAGSGRSRRVSFVRLSSPDLPRGVSKFRAAPFRPTGQTVRITLWICQEAGR